MAPIPPRRSSRGSTARSAPNPTATATPTPTPAPTHTRTLPQSVTNLQPAADQSVQAPPTNVNVGTTTPDLSGIATSILEQTAAFNRQVDTAWGDDDMPPSLDTLLTTTMRCPSHYRDMMIQLDYTSIFNIVHDALLPLDTVARGYIQDAVCE